MENIVFENRVINLNHHERDLLWISDLYEIECSIGSDTKIVELVDIYVPEKDRRQGIATKLIQDFITTDIKDDVLYFAFAGASKSEYIEEEFKNLTEDDWNVLFSSLDNFYSENGFVCVNKYIGTYEHKSTYLYLNEVGFELLRKIADAYSNLTHVYEFESIANIKPVFYSMVDDGLEEAPKAYKTDRFFVRFESNTTKGFKTDGDITLGRIEDRKVILEEYKYSKVE